jgi:predicted nucleotidyltransferase component of viral defense system
VIPETVLAQIANSSNIGDESLVTLDVVSVYLLEELRASGLLNYICFKGGNSLRKIFAIRPARFSRDLDFVDMSYIQSAQASVSPEDIYARVLEHLDKRTYHDIQWLINSVSNEDLFDANTLHMDVYFFIYDHKPTEDWHKNKHNILGLECSFRRPILLPPQLMPLRVESWFKHLEFSPGAVPVLQLEEAMAEKIRAAFQRTNPRDIYDLHEYAKLVFNTDLVKSLAVLKCWEDRGLYTGKTNFDPAEFFDKFHTDNYAWSRLKDQIPAHALVEPKNLIASIRKRFGFLSELSDIEIELCNDKAQKKANIHDSFWQKCKQIHKTKH